LCFLFYFLFILATKSGCHGSSLYSFHRPISLTLCPLFITFPSSFCSSLLSDFYDNSFLARSQRKVAKILPPASPSLSVYWQVQTRQALNEFPCYFNLHSSKPMGRNNQIWVKMGQQQRAFWVEVCTSVCLLEGNFFWEELKKNTTHT
jgi:hypothetical protein